MEYSKHVGNSFGLIKVSNEGKVIDINIGEEISPIVKNEKRNNNFSIIKAQYIYYG